MILDNLPQLRVQISCSLDGLEKTHDKIRGVKGNFKKVIKTIRLLNEIKNKRLSVVVNTVITKHNIKEIPQLMEFVKTLPIRIHSFEVMRGDPRSKTIKLPSVKEIKDLFNQINRNDLYYKRKSKFKRLFDLDKYTRKIQIDVLKNKKWPFRCLAGDVVAVIEANGDIKLCELLPKVGNLRESNYNFKKIFYGPKANEQRRWIKKTKCSCTHICFIFSTIEHNPLVSFIKIPLYNLRFSNV